MVSLKAIAYALTVVGVLGVSALAQADAPAADGIWEAENGITRWRVEVCGDQQGLCAYLHWIRPDMIGERNRQYIGQPVFEHLPPAGLNRWRGRVTIQGHTVNGTIELLSADELQLTACQYLIICQSTVLTRVPDAS